MKKNNNHAVDARPIIIYIAIQSIISLLAGFIIGITLREKAINKINEMTGIIMFASLTIIAAVFIIIYYQRLKDDFKRLHKKDYLIVLVTAVCWIIVNFLITAILTKLNITMENQDTIGDTLKASSLLTFISTVLFAPLAEEIVFRYSISTFFKKDIPFIIVSSIIFGALHTSNAAIIIYILMGAVFSITYVKTDKNIIASTLVHALNNLIAIISMFLMT